MTTRLHRALGVGAASTACYTVAVGLINAFIPIWALMDTWLSVATMIVGPFVVGTVVAIVHWKRDLKRDRQEHGMCGDCGYNLTGNESGVCPECGGTIVEKPNETSHD